MKVHMITDTLALVAGLGMLILIILDLIEEVNE